MYNQDVGVHILEQSCGKKRDRHYRPCAIEMIEGSKCEFPVGNAKHEGVTVYRNDAL
jgi:hypothetical protein